MTAEKLTVSRSQGDILITTLFPDEAVNELQKAGLTVDMWTEGGPMPPKALMERVVGKVAILLTPADKITPDVVGLTDPGTVFVTASAGYEHIDLAACEANGSPVGNAPDEAAEPTASTAVMLMQTTARNYSPLLAAHRDGTYTPPAHPHIGPFGDDLDSASAVGIVGAGRIGSLVAQRVHDGFGASVLYTGPHRKPEFEERFEATHLPLGELAAASDFVTLHVPLTPATEGMIGEEVLNAMGDGRRGFLINTSRGKVVKTEDLLNALQDGRIRGAGLDVCDPEPLPPGHPLHKLCDILPHIGSATQRARTAMARRAVHEALLSLNGYPISLR